MDNNTLPHPRQLDLPAVDCEPTLENLYVTYEFVSPATGMPNAFSFYTFCQAIRLCHTGDGTKTLGKWLFGAMEVLRHNQAHPEDELFDISEMPNIDDVLLLSEWKNEADAAIMNYWTTYVATFDAKLPDDFMPDIRKMLHYFFLKLVMGDKYIAPNVL
ncbi:hypothetical protein AVDCRST_MAG94-4276 [uncultured Leptolyngbya sp.]|uniref:Uncharacterized protein n=1 Tax=uncultured Leptolyngbya sp. TaxID=332963 RepID=A0A6J4MYS0_9CYAN|nr:hypothetical protein AVDCRST_MAG94-4276 [uncultured Leptolyngbya sp.]